MLVVLYNTNIMIKRLVSLQLAALAVLMVLVPVIVMAGKGFYTANGAVRSGMLVSLTKNPGLIESATDKNMSSLAGVVGAAPNDSPLKTGQVSVQTDGVVNTLVSTLAGDIQVGDHISPSVLVGVGSKSDGTSWIVGTAQASLSAATKDAVKSTVADAAGVQHEVYLATIPVLVKVTQENAAAKKAVEKTFVDSVAGKKASQVAVVLGFMIFIAGLIVAGIIANTAVRNGIISTARQPLSKKAVMGRMIQSILVALVILIAAVISSVAIVRII